MLIYMPSLPRGAEGIEELSCPRPSDSESVFHSDLLMNGNILT